MTFEVLLTEGAERDLEETYDYIASKDSTTAANRVLDRLLSACERLESIPERGAYPKELMELGIREYRQVFFKPYRVIYRIRANAVVIHLITDDRRDMQSLLSRRLLAK
ncbi:MAG: type II toxin-antitoxin system RelE/ParE family toxin [Gammaproteobacteria bacterium]